MSSIKEHGKTVARSTFLVALLFSALNQHASAGFTSPGIVTTQGGMPEDHYGLNADYMWNCGGADNCSPTQGPNQAIFELTFNARMHLSYPQYFFGTGAPNPHDPINNFALSVIADDYFAVYLNNHLLGWSWLNDGSSPNSAHFRDTPLHFTMGDLLPHFIDGENVLDIFACNGRTSDNLSKGYTPGETLIGGFSGCPNPSSYGNNWLLVEGGFVQMDNTPGGQVNASARFVSGNSETATGFSVVPEPATIAMIVTGLLGLGISRKKDTLSNPPQQPVPA